MSNHKYMECFRIYCHDNSEHCHYHCHMSKDNIIHSVNLEVEK